MRYSVREAPLLFHQVLKSATRPLAGGGVFDRSSGARAYRDMFLFEVSQLAAERGSLGLGALLESAEAAGDEKVTDG